MLHQNKEWLEQQHNAGLSIREIAQKANVSAPTIRTAFKKYGIKPRTISEALKIKPSKHNWTNEERQQQSIKMKEVQKERKEELSESSKQNWKNNRQTITNGIQKAAKLRLIDIKLPDNINKLTLKEIAIAHNISVGTVRRNLRSIGITNLAQYKKLTINIDKLISHYNNHTQEECGIEFGCSSTTISRILAEAGIDTSKAFGQDFKNKIARLAKQRWEDDDYRHKMAKARSKTNRISGIQRELYKLLDRLDIKYNQEVVVGPYTFDCLLTDHNILIECNGNYWHSLPQSVINDQNKANYIATYHQSYKLKAIWEHEFEHIDRIYHLIKYWTGQQVVPSHSIRYKDIQVREINPIDYREFLSHYHYLVYCNNHKFAFGAYYHDMLIGVIVFSSLLRQNLPYDCDKTLELSRLCIKPGYNGMNFGSWFIARSLSLVDRKFNKIVSYCDTSYNHSGGVYRASNFKLDHTTKPDYWYVAVDGWVIHKKTVYNRARKLGLRESDYAMKNNLLKVFSKEKLCFVLDR